MSEGIMKCELCQANVMSMGKTTHYYKNLDHERIAQLKQENKELRTRVAEAEEKLEDQIRWDKALAIEINICRKKRDELQNRLSTLKEHHDCLKHNYRILDEKREVGIDYATKEIDKLTMRLSTLLKASEGMEKALEMLYSELVESNSPRCDEWSTPAKIIKQALADFRAVKEAMNAKKEYEK